MKDIYLELAEIVKMNIPTALVTVVAAKGSTPRHPGAKMIVKADGSIIGTVGGASAEHNAIQEALKAIKDGKARKVTYVLHEGESQASRDKIKTGMVCGGEMEMFIEPITTAPILYLFGAGHVGKPTAEIAALCGFRVLLFDDRPEWANKERFPSVAEISVGDLAVSAAEIQPTAKNYTVIVTAGHDTDYIVLKNLLAKPFKYIGVICSKRKWKLFAQNLSEENFTDDLIQRIHAPIGIDIGSETPEEIAVSIIAELIKVKNLEK